MSRRRQADIREILPDAKFGSQIAIHEQSDEGW